MLSVLKVKIAVLALRMICVFSSFTSKAGSIKANLEQHRKNLAGSSQLSYAASFERASFLNEKNMLVLKTALVKIAREV